ncbi:MAG: SIR2 family protein [Chloroflexi bacterium]|nr:SIR2 family protein [Chloroflexota bacterium]
MADLTDIVLHLSTGRTIAWIGAGPSIEVGLPSWKSLANGVLEACRRQQRRNFSKVERWYQEEKYREMLSEVSLEYGRDFLHNLCQERFRDPGQEGVTYGALANLNFLAYFTTNYDDLLTRHLVKAGRAVKVYLNSKDELESVDIDTVPSLVKLHGDFSKPDSVVLTRDDYQKWYISGEGAAFQTFLKNHLARDRFLFVGYSLSDPEFVAFQERLAIHLHRSVKPIALLANVSDKDAEYWLRYYNIDVMGYRAQGSDHSELGAILESVAKFMSVGQVAGPRIRDEDLRQAQAMYMWHRFSPTRSGQAPVDAFQSVLLTLLVGADKSFQLNEIAQVLADSAGFHVSRDNPDLRIALERLVNTGWLVQENGRYHVPNENARAIRTYGRQFDDLIQVFGQQLAIDMMKRQELDEASARELARVALDTLMDIFETRGREILGMVFGDEPVSPSGAVELVQTIWRRSNEISEPTARAGLVSFVLDVLTKPSGIYETVLTYLAKAFFCIQALRIDPGVKRLVGEVVAQRALILDDNVLIPLIANGEERNLLMRQSIDAARKAGLALYTTQRFVEAVRRHANWAFDLVNKFGTQSAEVMNAALGQAGYEANAFLKGFVNEDPTNRDRDFPAYLQACFGGSYGRVQEFRPWFKEEFGVTRLEQSQLHHIIAARQRDYEEAKQQLQSWNKTREETERKSATRIESEAEAFLLVTEWDAAKKVIPDLNGSRASFVTTGSSVVRLIKAHGATRGKMAVVSPQGLWEILTRLDESGQVEVSFRSLMMSSYFRMAPHFVDRDKY